ncbi:hypothetical protein ACEPQ5_06980, partial [Staphylococcus aureus]|uniref:hypothetical protein n=1 Tax=Staphylococcus aureus TaxID=1280 RepID=UPI003F438ECA
MKIKVKKTMTLSELIEWAWENPELSNNKKFFARSNYLSGSVKFFPGLSRTITTNNIMFDDEFEVEVEEEITEETVIPSVVVVRTQYFPNGSESINVTKINNKSIKELIDSNPYNSRFKYHEFYLMNGKDLGELIWKDG